METSDSVKLEFDKVMAAVARLSADVAHEVEAVLDEGMKHPLSREEAHSLLTRVVSVLRKSAASSDDSATLVVDAADVEDAVQAVIEARDRLVATDRTPLRKAKILTLQSRNGIAVESVQPRPCFHGTEVAMNSGFVKTADIELWDMNERLEIHLGQFRQKNGRKPSAEELLDIMLSKMNLPGISDDDQFKIIELARSIAVNGVRKPPIVDLDGTLLDGNRRVTACRYILSSDEFTPEQKRRVDYIFVWQLTEHATADERNAVVVSLNFEPDCKQDWPEYVKARKVYEEWQSMLAVEPRSPGANRLAQLKRHLSTKFALGPDSATVNRYLKMVDWATEFEDFHIGDKGRDRYEVKHRANRYFQYFDEMAKGAKPGGVAYALNQDEAFKKLVFELLFEGKFKNWRQIRELKLIYDNEEARGALQKARDEADADEAEEHLENAMAIARSGRAEMREVGANSRIESFVKWLEELPVKAFRDHIKPEVLRRLLKALRLVEKHTEAALSKNSQVS